jgi:hypothetical protein
MSIPPITGTTGEEVLQSVADFLSRFILYPCEHSRVAHALWVLHTHLMDRWDSTPRIMFSSAEPGSGKSRALEASEPLIPRPMLAVNVSPAYLFRKVSGEDGPPTILYDEIDTVFGPKAKENEEIRALLNAGHRRGAVAGRCVVHGKTVTTEELPAYAAVAMAGLGWLPQTISSRSIIIRMRRRKAGEQVEPYRRRLRAPEGEEIRQTIESWAASFPTQVEWPELPPEIQDRDADVWEPLIAIADEVGGDWPELARAAAVALVTASKEIELSLGVRLLADIKIVFATREQIATAILLEGLCDLDEAPWGDLKGRALDSRGLAKRLREYGVKSRTIRIGDSTPKGYVRADFVDVWDRYLPPSPAKSATSATWDTNPEKTDETRVADMKAVADAAARVAPHVAAGYGQKPNKNGHCGAVADVAHFAANGGAADLPDIPPFLDRRPKPSLGQAAVGPGGPDDDLSHFA